MIRSYSRENYPKKHFPTFDLQDPYWRLMFGQTALYRAEQDCAAETHIPPPPGSLDEDLDDGADDGNDHDKDKEAAGLETNEACGKGRSRSYFTIISRVISQRHG